MDALDLQTEDLQFLGLLGQDDSLFAGDNGDFKQFTPLTLSEVPAFDFADYLSLGSPAPSLEQPASQESSYPTSPSASSCSSPQSDSPPASHSDARSLIRDAASPIRDAASPKRGRGTGRKKEKKRLQNREAATRYREKRKNEHGVLDDKKDALEKENQELRKTLGQMESEKRVLKEILGSLGILA
eukprot:m.306154 g.306154  ORF g.306154 m.306154 type:complete len:186 (+) comp41010_c0_seq1:195-752(+)